MVEKKFTRKQFIQIVATAGAAGAALHLGWKSQKQPARISQTRLMMGTIINLTVIGPSKQELENAVQSTFEELDRLISIFNFRSAESPLTQLNQTGLLVNPPQELVEVIKAAKYISQSTKGAFDITVKPLMDLYRESGPELPEAGTILRRLALIDFNSLDISPNKISMSKPGMEITLDGIAKGFIVDAGVAKLNKLGFQNTYVEAGGDLAGSGTRENSSPWKIGLQSPRMNTSDLVTSFMINNQAVATSGDYQNYFTTDHVHHHILDPRTGYSAPHLSSATVIAPSCSTADAYATALMVQEPANGIELLESQNNLEGILITKEFQVIKTSGFPS